MWSMIVEGLTAESSKTVRTPAESYSYLPRHSRLLVYSVVGSPRQPNMSVVCTLFYKATLGFWPDRSHWPEPFFPLHVSRPKLWLAFRIQEHQ